MTLVEELRLGVEEGGPSREIPPPALESERVENRIELEVVTGGGNPGNNDPGGHGGSPGILPNGDGNPNGNKKGLAAEYIAASADKREFSSEKSESEETGALSGLSRGFGDWKEVSLCRELALVLRDSLLFLESDLFSKWSAEDL